MSKRRSSKISTLGSQATSIVSVAMVLLIVGILAAIGIATRSATEMVRGNAGVIVRLGLQASDGDINAMKQYLSNAGFAGEYMFTSAEDVLAQEMEYNPEILQLIDENPYQAEFDVKLRPEYASSDSIRAISNELESLDYVDAVVSQVEAVESMNSAIGKVMLVLGCVAAALLLISVVLINNAVSLSIYSRRFVIQTMKLVGATGAFIRRPFIKAGIVAGLIASVVASALLVGIQIYLSSSDTYSYLSIGFKSTAAVCLLLFVLGLLICGASAMMATNRYLRATVDDIYLK